MADRPPLQHVACFIDDSEAAARALAQAAAVHELAGGRLSVVHVMADPGFFVSMAAAVGGAPPHDVETQREAARLWLAEEARTIPGAEPVLLEGQPEVAACAWAREHDCDLMVAATHRTGLERALLGSFATYVAHHSPCPVLLVPPAERGR
ncbi:universal stress protein [Miltoncostaea marina]|uniref:universal stress protein n=1 Tax=Miltoncostaea marina TaxID=2843215 RepID=UPI001C3C5BA4|nr:universal stress protein [Miltoncostaea marina]